jgi:hypothetical protein
MRQGGSPCDMEGRHATGRVAMRQGGSPCDREGRRAGLLRKGLSQEERQKQEKAWVKVLQLVGLHGVHTFLRPMIPTDLSCNLPLPPVVPGGEEAFAAARHEKSAHEAEGPTRRQNNARRRQQARSEPERFGGRNNKQRALVTQQQRRRPEWLKNELFWSSAEMVRIDSDSWETGRYRCC